MNIEMTSCLRGKELEDWKRLTESAGLFAENMPEKIALAYEGGELIATGARDGAVLKYIAIADSHRGEDLTASILTELRRDAFEDGHTHLFLYTKPKNRFTFESLLFYPVIETKDTLVMENRRGGFKAFLDSLPEAPAGKVGAIVMNANPFTLGHRALVMRAATECDRVFVFVLSENKSLFSANDRLNMVRLGCEKIENATVLPSGEYLISRATFPTYFLPDREGAKLAACEADIEIFKQHLAKRLNITKRYVGCEPTSPLTRQYNEMLKAKLPEAGIELIEIERIESEGEPISASRVRSLIEKGDTGSLGKLLPQTTVEYLKKNGFF